MKKQFWVLGILALFALSMIVLNQNPHKKYSPEFTGENKVLPLFSKPKVGRQPTQSTEKPASDFMESFQAKYPGNWRASSPNGNQRRPSSLSGGKIKLPDLSEKSFLNVAKDMAQLLELPAGAIPKSAHFSNESKFGKTVKVQQYHEGYPVYGAEMRFYATKNGPEIVSIDQTMVSLADANLQRRLSMEEAEAQALALYPEARLAMPTGLTLYPQQGSGQLAYQITIESQNDDRELLLSAQDGKVLLERSLRIH